MKSLVKAAIASAIIAAAANAQADQEYTVMEMFNDGATNGAMFNGTFDFNTTTLELTNLQGTLTDMNGSTMLSMVYGPATGQFYDPSSTYAQIVDNLSSPAIDVSLVVNNTMPTMDTLNSSYIDATSGGYLYGTEVSATITAVPVPAALPLLATGLLGLRAFGRKSRKA